MLVIVWILMMAVRFDLHVNGSADRVDLDGGLICSSEIVLNTGM